MNDDPKSRKDDLESVQERIHKAIPKAKMLWEEAQPELELAKLLVRIRKDSGLTQQEVATRGKWKKSYVSRLESARGGVPNLQTVLRYVEACGVNAGLIVGKSAANHSFHVIDSLLLNLGSGDTPPRGSLGIRDQDFEIIEPQ